MVELALVIVEPEQQRSDLAAVAEIAKAADHAIGGAQPLHLDHGALARPIGFGEQFGDDAVGRAVAGIAQPALRLVDVARGT